MNILGNREINISKVIFDTGTFCMNGSAPESGSADHFIRGNISNNNFNQKGGSDLMFTSARWLPGPDAHVAK